MKNWGQEESQEQSNVNQQLIDSILNGDMSRMVDCIQNKGANINHRNRIHQNFSGFTPIHFAAFIGNQQMVEWLYNNGADATLTTNAGSYLSDLVSLDQPQLKAWCLDKEIPTLEDVPPLPPKADVKLPELSLKQEMGID